jgi:hypothetical protein
MSLPINFYDVVGVVGASLILFGFFRISVGRWTNKSFWYELDNIIGPICMIIYQLHNGAYIGIVLNTVWIIVAFRGLTSFAQRYRKERTGKTGKPKMR